MTFILRLLRIEARLLKVIGGELIAQRRNENTRKKRCSCYRFNFRGLIKILLTERMNQTPRYDRYGIARNRGVRTSRADIRALRGSTMNLLWNNWLLIFFLVWGSLDFEIFILKALILNHGSLEKGWKISLRSRVYRFTADAFTFFSNHFRAWHIFVKNEVFSTYHGGEFSR